MENTTRRLFIAIPVEDENILDLLKTYINYLNKFSTILKIVAQENYHITIKFFGPVDAGKADILIKGFRALTGLQKSVFRIEEIGAFPSASNPSVIWAGIKYKEAPINEIVRAVEQLASDNGFPSEKRKFSPHLTLARIKRQKKIPGELKKYIMREHKPFSGSSVFKELVLFESTLKKQGPEYKKIAVLQLV